MLDGFLAPITRPVTGRLQRFELPLAELPTREMWEERVKLGQYIGYHAQVQLDRLSRGDKLKEAIDYSVETWTFGEELAMVFLPGEVVVDYSLRLKRELDRSRLWVNAYCNDDPCYIPSERVLKEGGYEGATAMTYYDLPAPFRPGLEDKIIAAVHAQLPATFKKSIDAGRQPGAGPALAAAVGGLDPHEAGIRRRTGRRRAVSD